MELYAKYIKEREEKERRKQDEAVAQARDGVKDL